MLSSPYSRSSTQANVSMIRRTTMLNQGQIPQVSKEQINFVKSLLSQKGMSAEQWVRQLCAQRGINVDEFMEQFKDVNIP